MITVSSNNGCQEFCLNSGGFGIHHKFNRSDLQRQQAKFLNFESISNERSNHLGILT